MAETTSGSELQEYASAACVKHDVKVEKTMPQVPPSIEDKEPPTVEQPENVEVTPENKSSDSSGSSEQPGEASKYAILKNRISERISGTHSKREWLLLGERVFSHPRYAVLIIAALALCFFERYWFVIMPLAVFFSIEWAMRFWLQKESGWRNRTELVFLFLDGIATVSMFSVLLLPTSALDHGIYMRIARLFRGMYMLRMLRIFRFLTHDTIVFSLPFSLIMVALAGIAWAMPEAAMYIGLILFIETSFRLYSLFRVLPSGKRRNIDLAFVVPDLIAAVSLLGVIPVLSSTWVLLRLARFLVILNPMGNILLATKRVASLPEIRQEGSMLAALFIGFMVFGSIAIWYLYPQLDINDDGNTDQVDYTFFQIFLYVFRVMVDPGAAPAESFTPLLATLTMLLVLLGVFFFALVVSLGSNIMKFMLQELANSPLSAREHLLFTGWNEQSLPILHKLGQLTGRMRDSFPSVWIFHESAAVGAGQVGNWLNIREVEAGSRDLIKRFKLSGVTQLIIFKQKQEEADTDETADIHHLARELNLGGLVVSDNSLPPSLSQVYQNSLGMDVIDSASIRARMLYQMHHCSHMPELGIYMFDVISGETGLYSAHWKFDIIQTSAGSEISHNKQKILLESWLSNCFAEGLNVLAARRENGSYILFSDLIKHPCDESFASIVALGRDQLLWAGILSHAFSLGESEHVNQLQTFTWPETWDLSMIFLGWHPGLPAMIEEMAERHHKLTCHVFSTNDEEHLTKQMRALRSIEDKVNEAETCSLSTSVHAWDGLDTEVLIGQLRGCKVMMLYPESHENGSEDSMLELWLHEVGTMLTVRKNNVKWWTPPKLMVLPRGGDNIQSLMEAALCYPLLDIRVGSPDAFHDVFMARQLLTQARKAQHPEEAVEDSYAYEFMDEMLGDAVLVEDVESMQLLEQGQQAGWESVYREALRRGWILMAYLDHDKSHSQSSAFTMLDQAFPLTTGHVGRMQILAGAPVLEMHAPHQTASLLFCRRGVLSNEEEPVVEIEQTQQVELAKEVEVPVTADETEAGEEEVTDLKLTQNASTEVNEQAVVEGEVMSETVWPKQADKRLLRVLEKQVEGSVELLGSSSEEGLVKLMEILDMGVSPEVEAKLMEALTDLQNIDRVSQRLNNVKSCLSDWSESQPETTGQVLWEEEVSKRYVMEEERLVLRGEL